jgi:hypothetical protein
VLDLGTSNKFPLVKSKYQHHVKSLSDREKEGYLFKTKQERMKWQGNFG